MAEEELRRRRLAAANDRYERSGASLAALDVDLGAAISTYGPLSVSIPRASRPLGNEASDWEGALMSWNAAWRAPAIIWR